MNNLLLLQWKIDFMKMYERIGMVEDNIINYIIPYIEKNYNVSKKASDRAFCGISMGAMITTYMYFDYPEYFGYFGAFSGFDSRAISQKCKKYIPVFYTTIGTCDTGSTAILANPNGVKIKYENFLEWNQQNQVENVIDGGHIPGAHDWSVWQISFMKFISEICWKK